MFSASRGLLILVCAATLTAQTPAPKQAPAGLETDWAIAPVLQEISAHAARLLTMLDKFDPQEWIKKGASDTYAAQLESAKQQAHALQTEANALAANPEKLSQSLTVLFRIQGVDAMLGSIEEVIRKYHSPADAQALAILAAENDANRNRFQQYIVNLAAEREQDLAVMDKEAQRCRDLVTRPTSPAPRRTTVRRHTAVPAASTGARKK